MLFVLAACVTVITGPVNSEVDQDWSGRGLEAFSRETRPFSFENRLLFEIKGNDVFRSDRFTLAGELLGDFDGDDDLDQLDFVALQICQSFSGPAIPIPSACLVFDFDADSDVDLMDVAIFNTHWTGRLQGLLVEAGELLPIAASEDGYYSGEPGTPDAQPLSGVAAQSGYNPSDLWYEWTIRSAPAQSGEVVIVNPASAQSSFAVLAPLLEGDYEFLLEVTNLISFETASDVVILSVFECVWDRDCDDGLFCNGAETCCPSRVCSSGASPCGEFAELCNEADDRCEPRCESNLDCDNGLFCDGGEYCSLEGTCVSGVIPCVSPNVCNEGLNRCDSPPTNDFFFTLGVDNLTGTVGSDRFFGNLNFNAPTGTNVPSVQTGDSANGGDGDDRVTAVFNFTGATTVAPTLMGIERLIITDFGTAATTMQGLNISGLLNLETHNSTNSNAFIVNNLANRVDVGITNNGAGLSVGFLTSATSGPNDVLYLTLSNATGGTLSIVSATINGIETMTINSTTSANTLAGIVQTTGSSLSRLNVAGAARLTVGAALPSSVVMVDASQSTGGVSLNLSGNPGNVTCIGGTGNDTWVLGGTYSFNDTVSGGAGIDTLALTSASAETTFVQSNVSSLEALTVVDGLAHPINASRFGSISTVNLQGNFVSVVALTLSISGSTVNVGARTASMDGTANGTIDFPGLGTTDSLTLNINDSDTTAAYILTGIETLNLSSNDRGDGSAADGGVNFIGGALTMVPTFGIGTITLTGTKSLTLGGALSAGTLNASAFQGNLTMSAPTTVFTVISSGPGNDVIFGSAATDSLNAGGGSNVIESRGGVDAISLGSGPNTVRISSAASQGADRKLISGFSPGSSGHVVNIDANDLSILDGSNNFSSASAIQIHSIPGNLTIAAATEIVRVASASLVNFTDANSLNGTNLLTAIGGAITVQANGNEHLFLIGDASGHTGIFYGDAGTDASFAANELTLIAVLQSVPVAALTFQNFSNVN